MTAQQKQAMYDAVVSAKDGVDKAAKKFVENVTGGKVDDVVDTGNDLVELFGKKISVGKQGKHIVGHNNYIEGKSILYGTIEDAQKLMDEFAGSGKKLNDNKERVNFGRVIGKYVDSKTGEAVETTNGIIHYSNKGAHIVPARP